MPTTMRDIARELNLSQATVSKALTGRNCHDIQAETQERVRAAAQRLGYRPNLTARSLRSGRTNQISLLVRRVHPAFYSRSIAAFQTALTGSEYDIRIQQTWDWTPEQWAQAVSDSSRVDGLIVLESIDSLSLIRDSAQTTLPIVNVGAAILHAVDHVEIDLYEATAAAVRHLLEVGRSRIAYLGTPVAEITSRGGAYTETMRQAGKPTSFFTMEVARDDSLSTRSLALQTVTKLLESGSAVDALVCLNDEIAIGALRAIMERGLRVPEDIAIVGCDDIEETAFHYPTLSTLHYPYDEAARRAWEMLQRRMANANLPKQTTVLSSQLVIRNSSALPKKESL